MWKIHGLPIETHFEASLQGGEFPDYWEKKERSTCTQKKKVRI